MPRKEKDDDIKIVVTNPERMDAAKEKLMEFLYEEYMSERTNKEDKKIAQ